MADIPEPYLEIHRCFGRRSFPEDWPKAYDCWDAYDADDEFLFTLDYQALAILFDGQTMGHDVRLEFEDAEPIIIPPSNSFDLTISIDLGQGVVVKNPDRLVSRRELSEMMAAVLRGP